MKKRESVKGRLIYLIGDTQGLLYRNLAFYTLDLEKGDSKIIAHLPIGGIKGVLCHSRLFTRLLRLEPKCAGRLDDNRYVVSVVGKLWLLDISKKEITELSSMRPGYSVLNFCEKEGFVYWGDYGANPNYDEINVYRLDKDLNTTIVYKFPKDSIRHIHNIIKTEDGFIVLAGDNEPKAGIYCVNADWTEVKSWKNGEQKYRAVVGFPYNGGFLYATDSVETENYLRLIEADGSERILTTINGSCIYGGETKDFYLFSTTVESHEGGGIMKLLSTQLGGGIKNRDVHIIAVDKKDLSIHILKQYKKDIWPMKLLQYGTAVFPQGQENNVKGVWCYNMACKKYDGKSEYIRYDE